MAVVSDLTLAYQRGRRLWRMGKPRPPRPDDEDDCTSAEFWCWCGYMTARGVDYLKRCELAEKMGGDSEKVRPTG